MIFCPYNLPLPQGSSGAAKCRKMKKAGFIFILLMATLSPGAEPCAQPVQPLPAVETVQWDILLWGNKIGRLTGTHRTLDNGMEEYEMSSESRAKILWIDKEVTSHVKVVLQNGRMVSSIYKEIEDGKVKSWYNIKQNGNGYLADGHNGPKNIQMPVLFPLCALYFKELTGATKGFDEAGAQFVNMAPAGPSCWEYKANGGRYVVYTEKGRAIKIDVHTSLVKVVMEKR